MFNYFKSKSSLIKLLTEQKQNINTLTNFLDEKDEIIYKQVKQLDAYDKQMLFEREYYHKLLFGEEGEGSE